MGIFDFLKKRRLARESMADNAIGLHNIGVLYMDQGLYAEAEIFFARAIEIIENHLDLQSPSGAKSLAMLARANELQGKTQQAIENYQKSLAIKFRGLGEDHPSVIQAHLEIEALMQAANSSKDATARETSQKKPKAEVYQYLILKFDGLLQPLVMHSAVAGINTDVRQRLIKQAEEVGGILFSAPSKALFLPAYQVGSRFPLDPTFTPEK